MSDIQALIAAASAVVLFLYALQGFSREIRAVGGEALQTWLTRVTANRWLGLVVGCLATAVIQSSSAVTSLTAALVDAGVITFRGSLAVLLGANVGTTATAWLVSLKLVGIGPFCIVLGSVLSLLPVRGSVAGKALFYFGLVLFALDLISTELRPWSQRAAFVEMLAMASNQWIGVLAGLVVTAIIQSSSVTTGVAILLVQQGALPPEAAIFIVVGANVGSTSTALVASAGMSPTARATALSNLVFNAIGLAVCLPFLSSFAHGVVRQTADPAMAVAWAHVAFNLLMSIGMVSLLGPLEPRLRRLGGGELASST